MAGRGSPWEWTLANGKKGPGTALGEAREKQAPCCEGRREVDEPEIRDGGHSQAA